jgi:hypothetical protein
MFALFSFASATSPVVQLPKLLFVSFLAFMPTDNRVPQIPPLLPTYTLHIIPPSTRVTPLLLSEPAVFPILPVCVLFYGLCVAAVALLGIKAYISDKCDGLPAFVLVGIGSSLVNARGLPSASSQCKFVRETLVDKTDVPPAGTSSASPPPPPPPSEQGSSSRHASGPLHHWLFVFLFCIVFLLALACIFPLHAQQLDVLAKRFICLILSKVCSPRLIHTSHSRKCSHSRPLSLTPLGIYRATSA